MFGEKDNWRKGSKFKSLEELSSIGATITVDVKSRIKIIFIIEKFGSKHQLIKNPIKNSFNGNINNNFIIPMK